ncbi:MAG: TMEM165/GDT1 family protein [Gammaproteobacteria bacterium]
MTASSLYDPKSLGDFIEFLLRADFLSGWSGSFFSGPLSEWLVTAGTSFSLIAAAEIGDKSQVVCMTLAARYHRAGPVLLGAIAAFAMLNFLAVAFGVIVATWVPEIYLMTVVALLFTLFGIHALGIHEDDEAGAVAVKGKGNMFLTTFALITVAEFGDKTQLAVAGLGSTMIPASVWAGATVALAVTSAFGVWAGKSFLRKLPINRLHRISGLIFLGLAIAACYRIVLSLDIEDWERLRNFW